MGQFFLNFLITFHHYYYANYIFDLFNMVDFFLKFLLHHEVCTEILIVLNF